MQPVFTIKEAVSFGWKKTFEHIGFLVLLTLGFIVASAILDKLGNKDVVEVIATILNIAVSYFAMYTFVRIGLMIYRGETPKAKDVFTINWRQFGLYILASLLTMLLTGIGFILLILPGIYLTVRLGLFGFALIEEGKAPVDSLKRSMELTRGRFWHLLGLSVVLFLINCVGVLLFGVGLLVTAPLCLLATVFVYERLKAAPSLATPTVAPMVPPTSAPTV